MSEHRIYTVHHRRGDEYEAVADAFSVFALIVPVIWAVWHRCWVTLLAIVLAIGLAVMLSPWAASPLMYALGLGLAFEGGWVRRLELSTQGWRQVGLVEAASPEGAEELYLTGRVA